MATPRLKDVENQDNTKRDWLELPHDVMSLIFIKLGAIDILYRAQWVCSSWRNLSKQPYLFHSIDLCYKADNKDYCGIDYKLVKEAFDRSCGHLVEFFADEYWFSGGDYLDYFADNSIALKCFRFNFEGFTPEEELLLIDVIRKAPSLEEIGVSYYHHFPTVFLEEVGQLCPKLRCLRLRCNRRYYDVQLEELIIFVRNFPFLEELELCYIKFPAELIKEIGRSCTQLQCLSLDNKSRFCLHLDLETCGIAENIPQIRRLQLSSCELTNYGIKWMLNRCTTLEYLDISSCSIRDLEITEQTTKICEKSGKTVRLPNDDGKHRWDDYAPNFYQNHFYDLDSLGF